MREIFRLDGPVIPCNPCGFLQKNYLPDEKSRAAGRIAIYQTRPVHFVQSV